MCWQVRSRTTQAHTPLFYSASIFNMSMTGNHLLPKQKPRLPMNFSFICIPLPILCRRLWRSLVRSRLRRSFEARVHSNHCAEEKCFQAPFFDLSKHAYIRTIVPKKSASKLLSSLRAARNKIQRDFFFCRNQWWSHIFLRTLYDQGRDEFSSHSPRNGSWMRRPLVVSFKKDAATSCSNPGVASAVVRLSREYKSDIYSFNECEDPSKSCQCVQSFCSE